MAENSTIEWTDHTWSPWIGCTKISPACDGCYAEHLMDTRLGRVAWGPHGERSRTSAGYWRKPLTWNRQAGAAGRVATVFPSLCDPFDNRADPAVRREWFDLMRATPNLLWLILTKRPQNAVAMSEAAGGLPENAALGTTCEDQKRANRNVAYLKTARSYLEPKFIFLSIEPMLGPVCLWRADAIRWFPGGTYDDGGERGYDEPSPDYLECVDWVITGGETGQGKHEARPTHPNWFRMVRDQCAEAGVPYLHKQNGEWTPRGPESLGYPLVEGVPRLRLTDRGEDDSVLGASGSNATWMQRVGKKLAGRLLDGVEHNGKPKVCS